MTRIASLTPSKSKIGFAECKAFRCNQCSAFANAVKQSRELTHSMDCFVPRSDDKRRQENKLQ